MCCFSQPVEVVAGTQIFARPVARGRQVLAYTMEFAAAGELAMVLPLPVPPRPAEDAVRFIDLSRYDDFFGDVGKAFPPLMAPQSRGATSTMRIPSAPILTVHDVGEFEASFVPTLADFVRLDPRFRLAPEVWEQLPGYADWGFAVFKLKAAPEKKRGLLGRLFKGDGPEKRRVHPMAFEFPRRDPSALFFPTVHVHDGVVRDEARFDHTLYCQPDPATAAALPWEVSAEALGRHVDPERSAGIIDPDAPCFRKWLHGNRPNRDQLLACPDVSDPSLMVRRGTCFELTLRATMLYDEAPVAWQAKPGWKQTATARLDLVGTRLAEAAERELSARRDALPLAAPDASWRLFSVGPIGQLSAVPNGQARGQPTGDEPVRLEIWVSDDRIEPQRFEVGLTRAPSHAEALGVKQVLERALLSADLPAAPAAGGT